MWGISHTSQEGSHPFIWLLSQAYVENLHIHYGKARGYSEEHKSAIRKQKASGILTNARKTEVKKAAVSEQQKKNYHKKTRKKLKMLYKAPQ